MLFCAYNNEGMSQSGSSEYPLPLTGPIPKPESGFVSYVQNSIESENVGVNSSTSRRVPISASQGESNEESLRIYSVKTHQRHKQPVNISSGDKTEASLSNINNNNNYQLEKEVRLHSNDIHQNHF